VKLKDDLLVQNHAFIDGTKRVGAAAAPVFSVRKGWEAACALDDLVDLVLEVAQSGKSKAAIAEFFRQHCSPVKEKSPAIQT
jgi:prophage maintenance system killer protein